MSLTKYRERMGIPNDVDDDVAFDIFKSGGEVIISKVVENGVDLCPHEWEEIEEKREISRGLGCKVYRCIKGCLRFVFRSRSSLGKWLWGYRSFPKIAGKLPTEGYYSDDWFHRKFGMNPQTVSDYYKLTEGLDIDGVPAYIKADEGRVFFYRDDPEETAPTNSKRTISIDRSCKPGLKPDPPSSRADSNSVEDMVRQIRALCAIEKIDILEKMEDHPSSQGGFNPLRDAMEFAEQKQRVAESEFPLLPLPKISRLLISH